MPSSLSWPIGLLPVHNAGDFDDGISGRKEALLSPQDPLVPIISAE